MVISISYTPCLLILPQAEINFVPVDLPIPILAYSAPPSLIIGTTAAIVSTLFTTVGQSHNPFTAGKGGLILGLPLLPSNDSSNAVSSPHIYAPAPRWIYISQSTPLPRIFFPSHPLFLASLIACSNISTIHANAPLIYI